jgi:ABC-type sulfate/molybdate transport systems ATPase subunit
VKGVNHGINSGYRKGFARLSTAGVVHLRDSTLGLLGSSGSGKSMTLRCIAGLDRPTRGRIALGEKILYDSEAGINLPPQERKVGFLFQNYALFPHLTVAGNIKIGLRGLEKKKQAKIIQRNNNQGKAGRVGRQVSPPAFRRAATACCPGQGFGSSATITAA